MQVFPSIVNKSCPTGREHNMIGWEIPQLNWIDPIVTANSHGPETTVTEQNIRKKTTNSITPIASMHGILWYVELYLPWVNKIMVNFSYI